LFAEKGGRVVMARERSSDVAAACRKLMKEETAGERLVRVWIWEYVLKFSSDKRLIRELMDCLAFPNDVPRLKQMVLLKELSGQIGRGLVLQKTLDLLEGMREVMCDARRVADSGALVEDEVRQERKRVKGPTDGTRIPGAESDSGVAGGNGVDGGQEKDWDDLVELITEVREEVQDEPEVESSVARKRKYKEVENKLKAFIAKAWIELGPVFLEKVEVAVVSGLYKGVTGNQLETVPSKGKAAATAVDEEELADKVVEEVANKEVVEVRAADLEKGRQGLQESVAQLEKLVKDPLPAVLERTDANGGNVSTQVPASTSGREERTAARRARRNFLDPHPSARSHEWGDDEIAESPPTDSPSASRRVRLPPLNSPRRMSPLVEIQTANQPRGATSRGNRRRRKNHKWSEEEVETLKREVGKYGKGRWKLILQKNYDVFQDRTEVHLKDKWRNMEKYEGIREDDLD